MCGFFFSNAYLISSCWHHALVELKTKKYQWLNALRAVLNLENILNLMTSYLH